MKYKTRKLYSACKITGLKARFGKKIVFQNGGMLEKRIVFDCRENGKMSFDTATIEQNVYFASSGDLTVGKKTFFNRNAIVVCRDKIEIGDNCIFGPNVCIYDHDHNFGENGREPGFKTSPVKIGNNCWLGAGAVVLRGSVIGDNCVIGAGTVVHGEIPKNSIVKSNRDLSVAPLINKER